MSYHKKKLVVSFSFKKKVVSFINVITTTLFLYNYFFIS